MYRVLVVIGGGLALAACSAAPDWLNFDGLKPAPLMDTVRFESEPPGAEAKVSNGQACRTPCALALSVNSPVTVTFMLNGYLPESESIEPITIAGSPPQLRPNPVMVELSAAPPGSQKPVAKKPPAPKKKTADKPAAKPAAARATPAAATASTPASAPMTAAPAQQQAPAPWPASPPPAR
jgi:hypothetical protein